MLAILTIYSVAFVAIWYYRHTQMRFVKKQKHFYTLFYKNVVSLQDHSNIPASVRNFITLLVKTPLEEKLAKSLVKNFFKGSKQHVPDHIEKEIENMFREVGNLDEEIQNELSMALISFIFALSYSSTILGGFLFRRFLIGGYTRRTQQKIAIESIYKVKSSPTDSNCFQAT